MSPDKRHPSAEVAICDPEICFGSGRLLFARAGTKGMVRCEACGVVVGKASLGGRVMIAAHFRARAVRPWHCLPRPATWRSCSQGIQASDSAAAPLPAEEP